MDDKKLVIKEWAFEDRPREKLLSKGIAALSDAELVAIIIGSGSRNETAVELAKKILLKVNNNLNELGKITIQELIKNFHGIGEAKAISIIAALELGKRRKIADIIEKKEITCSKDVAQIFQPLLCDLPHEEFWILLMNFTNKIIDKYRISQGGIAGTVTDIKIIMKCAIDRLASSIILCHNHPSGKLAPSQLDIDLTMRLKSAGELLEIKTLDHIIVTEKGFYSFADEGIM
jgi:DNA repair protein RadC